ncbi:metal-dependent hydrolase [Cytobacillus sp. NCCP-133]|uniref:metal-dependent hydrolase n=1 Tax=Cytobacillus sp. NCCP-133 TaxID=766848 RepID=UPI0022313DB9|nr:metal-dependent hydrolase [Cytobacillus sp. NCCP-133]GLB59573.1 hypothetical protein NCCP133_17060 [Cytobacillus sp. NCCP-133]
MNGTAHAAIGAAAGYVVANTVNASTSETLLLVGLGVISGLIPDLDIDGKLRDRITLSHEVVRTVSQLIGILMVIYSFCEGSSIEKWMGIAIGIGMISIASRIKQKHMLTLTGIGVLAGGASLQELWMILFGVYMFIASFIAHRSYTHSIIGVIFFGYIAFRFEMSLGIHGVYYTCLAGYIFHLAADLKLLPFNKRGIKLFLPISSKEI